VAFDREDTLKKAEKLLRQGRLEPAIAEYLRVVEAESGDWVAANTLGDLYVRAGQSDKAAAQYSRIALHFVEEGFLPKAAALYKKLLKLNPDDEASQLQLADISQRQGLLADACLTAGHATEARVIAEDLVACEPWERDHIERFRRALVMLKISDPASVIAERLSGMTPFMTTDVFAEHAATDPSPSAASTPAVALDSGAGAHDAVTTPEPPTERQISAEGSPVKPIPLSTVKPAGSDEIDLTGALGELHSGAAPSGPQKPESQASGDLDETLQGLRQEALRQAASDQSAQHMTLARTYLEMGLPEQAIGSLQTAARSPRFRFEAASILGRIYKDRGQIAQAAEWLERASEAPAPTADEGRALVYDLATVLEQHGETVRALALLLELQSDAGDYRDIADRIDRLSRVETETGG
jgi:tetratricopeptide (TPR) repeat protein